MQPPTLRRVCQAPHRPAGQRSHGRNGSYGQPLAGWKRSPAGSEIDFIVKTGPAAVPVECKASLSVNLRHMRGLIAYLRAHGRHRGYIASLAPYAQTSVDGVQIVNLPAYLLERLVKRDQ